MSHTNNRCDNEYIYKRDRWILELASYALEQQVGKNKLRLKDRRCHTTANGLT